MTQIQCEMNNKVVNVALPSILDVPSSEALRDAILDSAAPGSTLKLDSKEVEQLTTPGIQVLLATAEWATRKEMAFKIANPSEALIEAFKDSGLFSQLMAWDLE